MERRNQTFFMVVIEKCNSTELQLFIKLLFLVTNYIFGIENKER
jgi:hypothetical protein